MITDQSARPSTVFNAAADYLHAGLSIVPIKADGSKQPAVSAWKQFEQRPPTTAQAQSWYAGEARGVAIVGGKVSGNLECVDVDAPELIADYFALIEEHAPGLVARLVIVETPRGGRHLIYRCAQIAGNQKLALRPVDNDPRKAVTLFETRGEGGYLVAPGSPAVCHSTGRTYQIIQGDFAAIPTITPEERAVLHDCARSFNEHLKPSQQKSEPALNNGLRPGEDFNQRGDVRALLERHGWRQRGKSRAGERWVRPDGDRPSATLFSASGKFYVFSTNAAPLEFDRAYSAFNLLTQLEHGGDFHAAAQALAKEGYGGKGAVATTPKNVPAPEHATPTPKPSAPKSAEPPSVKVRRLADVQPETVTWLWQPYMALGKVTMIEGDPGVGKSYLTCALATAVAAGQGLPGMIKTAPQNVLMMSAEDGLEDTIRPRLDAMGADVTRIYALDEPVCFDDIGFIKIETAIIEYGPALVIVDPLVAYLGAGVDMHRANESRAVMTRLAELAKRHACAIAVVRHLSKGGGGKAIYRGQGSIDFLAAVRSSLLVGADPDQPQKRAIVQIKNNLAAFGDPLGYEIKDGAFYWTGHSDLTAQRILAASGGEEWAEESNSRADAEDFLRVVLGDGPRLATDVEKEAKEAKISFSTLRRAKDALGVKSRKFGGKFGGDSKWYWTLPEDAHAEDAHDPLKMLTLKMLTTP